MHLDLFHCKSTACLPGGLWVISLYPVSKQGAQGVCSVLPGILCAASRHNMSWFGQPFPCIWLLQLQGAMMPVGYKTWANPDTDVPFVHLSGSPSHPGDNYLTRHCSPSLLLHPVMQTKVSRGFLPGSVLNCSFHPTACCPCCHCSLCSCCWDIETKDRVFCV